MSETNSGSGLDPVDRLLESFVARWRAGERPSPADYAARCPERADEILELFPAAVELEELGPGAASEAGPTGPPHSGDGSAGRPGPPHPERLGDDRILRVVGEGGMGVVYEAERQSLSSRVALKVMHPRFRADGSHLRRFRLEARSAARLHHTNIVPVFDFGEHDGICYYAMQYIVGVGLDAVLDDVRRLRQQSAAGGEEAIAQTEPIDGPASAVARGLVTGRFTIAPATPFRSHAPTQAIDAGPNGEAATEGVTAPPAPAPQALGRDPGSSSIARQPETIYHREIARLGAQVADAPDYAHRQGVVHRDIKPSNLLLDAQGNAWVTDFGLAKLLVGDEPSCSGDLVGTLRYMAPERFRGVTDRRGDIYALGATLYEMLALRPPFDDRDRIRLIERITHEPPVPLRQHDRRIPRDLETVVLKAMARDPADRFAAAGELRDELRRFFEGRPIRSRRVPVYEQVWRWCKRNRALAAATIAAAALTVFVAVTAPIVAWTYRDQVKALEIEQGRTRASLARAEKAEREGRLDLGKSHLAEGAALLRTGMVDQRLRTLEQVGKAVPLLRGHPEGLALLPKLRDQAIAAMGLTDLRLVRRRAIGPVMDIAWDGPLERYATTELLAKPGVGGLAIVRSMADDRELLRIPRPGPDFWWAWTSFSPDGRYLLVGYGLGGGGGDLYDVWHPGRGERVFRQRSHGLIFHPDGRRLIHRPAEKELAIWDLTEGRETRRLPLDFVPATARLDPDGRRLAVNAASAPRKVAILDPETGRTLATWTGDVGNGGAMDWSPDGRLLAVGTDDGRLFVRDAGRGTLASVLHEDMEWAASCQFSPAGSLLLTTSGAGPFRIWDATTGRLLVAGATTGDHARLSSDGRRSAHHDGDHLDLWEIVHGPELIALNPRRIGNWTANENRAPGTEDARYSPDGRLVAVTTLGGVYLYDGHEGRELGRLMTRACDSALFDREGRNLVTHSERGVFRWPIRDDPGGGPGALSIGPPSLLFDRFSVSRYKARWLPDGRTLAMNDEARQRLLLVDTGRPHPARQRPRMLATPTQSRMISVAVSPDGRWAAAGGWNDEGAYVWDLPRRRFDRILPRGETSADGHTLPAFSPDGRWLVVHTDAQAASGYYFWEVGTWRRGPYIPRSVSVGWAEPVFSPDGALIALSVAPDRVRLQEVATGRTIAHLTIPQPLSPAPLAFSPDGTRLIACTERQTFLAWDLRRIRERLRAMGLDWDRPPDPPEEATPGAALPPVHSVRVLGEAPEPEARRAADLAACDARLRDHPDDVDALFDRGWLKLKMSRPAEAIPDLERGLRLRPDDADALYSLASAQLGTNDRAAARATLETYLARAGDDTDARVLKGQLALQLGRLAEADDDYGKALDLDPARDPVRYARAQVRLRLGRLDGALADLDELVPRYPRDADLLAERGQVHDRLGHRDRALADLKQAAGLPQAPARFRNNLAWRLATGPAALRDPRRALELAREAVAAEPDEATYLNTLGVAQYRNGRLAEAVATLERSLSASRGASDAFDLFFLAMARHRLGRYARARADFDQAVKWRAEPPSLPSRTWAEELDAFEAEARAVLDAPLPDLPADVLAPAPPARIRPEGSSEALRPVGSDLGLKWGPGVAGTPGPVGVPPSGGIPSRPPDAAWRRDSNARPQPVERRDQSEVTPGPSRRGGRLAVGISPGPRPPARSPGASAPGWPPRTASRPAGPGPGRGRTARHTRGGPRSRSRRPLRTGGPPPSRSDRPTTRSARGRRRSPPRTAPGPTQGADRAPT